MRKVRIFLQHNWPVPSVAAVGISAVITGYYGRRAASLGKFSSPKNFAHEIVHRQRCSVGERDRIGRVADIVGRILVQELALVRDDVTFVNLCASIAEYKPTAAQYIGNGQSIAAQIKFHG